MVEVPKVFLDIYAIAIGSEADEQIQRERVEGFKTELRDWTKEDLLAYVSKEENLQGLQNDPNLAVAFFELLQKGAE